MILCVYTEDPKYGTRKLLELINEFGKVRSYKINTQKSVAFPYTNSEKLKREIQETIQLIIISKSKVSRNKPTKGDRNLYWEN